MFTSALSFQGFWQFLFSLEQLLTIERVLDCLLTQLFLVDQQILLYLDFRLETAMKQIQKFRIPHGIKLRHLRVYCAIGIGDWNSWIEILLSRSAFKNLETLRIDFIS